MYTAKSVMQIEAEKCKGVPTAREKAGDERNLTISCAPWRWDTLNAPQSKTIGA